MARSDSIEGKYIDAKRDPSSDGGMCTPTSLNDFGPDGRNNQNEDYYNYFNPEHEVN